jgi:predicted dehydrogenase
VTDGRTAVGIIGCGKIFDTYADGLARFPDQVRIARIADVDVARAEEAATRKGIERWGTPAELLADPELTIVISLTPPVVHADVTTAALAAGKHVYTEKPLAATTAEAAPLFDLARSAGRLLGSAPDTFLGSGGQTARAVVDSGALGEVIGFTLVGSHSRAELWHPDPTFLFSPGGGPLLDVGPYFVTQLVHLLGPVARVMGKTRIGAAQRQVTAPDRLVDVIDVTVPTHATAVLELASGAIGTYLHSFDVWNHRHPHIEIYGSLGTLTVPHPNWFGGDVELQLNTETAAHVVEPVAPPIPGEGMGRSSFRGFGVLDLIGAIGGAPHRTSATLAYHTLEVLEAIQRSSDSGSAVEIRSQVERPEPLTAAEVAALTVKTPSPAA